MAVTVWPRMAGGKQTGTCRGHTQLQESEPWGFLLRTANDL